MEMRCIMFMPLRAVQGGYPANVCDEHTELKWFGVSERLLLTNIVDSNYPLFAQQAFAVLRGKSINNSASRLHRIDGPQ